MYKKILKQYTITHKATDVEDVNVFVNNKKIELSPGQCLNLSEDDFQDLRVSVGAGAKEALNLFSPQFGTVDLCGGSSKVVCAVANYDIVDKGTMFDNFQIDPASFNKSCTSQ